MLKEIRNIVGFLIVFFLILLSPFRINPNTVSAQANLVEEENQYIIYAGNEYTAIIPKNKGPEMSFSAQNFGDVILKINYISEYTSPTQYLNSLNHLSGKGYSLDKLIWDSIGFSDMNKTSVNLSRTFLDKNTTLDFSFNIFNQNHTINDLYVEAISNPYLELNVHNWSYTPGSRGLALNLQAFIEDNNDYLRLGPFVDIINDDYAAQVSLDNYKFEVRLNSEITMIKLSGEEVVYTTMFFANYAVAQPVNEPADFWISIPQITDVNQIIFSFVCSIGMEQTSPVTNGSYGLFIFGLTSIAVLIRFFSKKRSVRN
jgi:hypothetical protein